MQNTTQIDWSDWSDERLMKTNTKDSAAEKGCSRMAVCNERRRRGLTVPGARRPSKLGVDWDAVDFMASSDAEIAASLGVQEKAVRRARRTRGVVKTAWSPSSRLLDRVRVLYAHRFEPAQV